MWETMADEIIAAGGEVRLNTPVTQLESATAASWRVDAGGERIECREVISSLPLRLTVGITEPAAAGASRTPPRPALPRLPDRRAGDRRRGPVPGQLDLHPRAGRPRRPDPELPLLEPVDGARTRQGVRRPGVLLLPGRRPVGRDRRGARRAGEGRDPAARPRRPREGRARLRDPRAARLPDVRRRLRRARRRRSARGWRRSPTSSRSAATGCTATTTPTTRC